MVQWAKQIAERRGVHVAIMALARKLAHVLYALWKHQTSYDPSRAAQLTAQTDARRASQLDGCPEAMTAHETIGTLAGERSR
jgi:hypothetical protein